eukprot:8341955-Lingulodinium_polyedra.AAC.1
MAAAAEGKPFMPAASPETAADASDSAAAGQTPSSTPVAPSNACPSSSPAAKQRDMSLLRIRAREGQKTAMDQVCRNLKTQ